MEQSGFFYLHTLASVSLSFVGFSTLLLIFRQARGEVMTRYESYFMLSFMLPGFIVTAGSLLPSVVGLYGFPATTVWRVSSSIMALPILLFVTTLPRRRRAATSSTMPRHIRFFAVLQLLIALYLLTNALGVPTAAAIAPYAAAMTGLLFTTAIAYVWTLSIALGQPPSTSP